ncbi:DoxX family protein [Salinirubellus sp. GCM10025818]|uniref:DoxX family protein n=1 Tax=Salinirubellus TaxID=2162630 RepID=UPI0030CCDB83
MSYLALQAGVFAAPGSAELFLLARVLFGGVLAFMGLNHFTNLGDMAGYAGSKGVPAPNLAVAFTGGLLVLGGLSVIVGAFVVLGAGALSVFLLASAVGMHDFWTVEDPQQQQTEMTQFLKNVSLAGAAVGLLALGGVAWPYSVGVGLF